MPDGIGSPQKKCLTPCPALRYAHRSCWHPAGRRRQPLGENAMPKVSTPADLKAGAFSYEIENVGTATLPFTQEQEEAIGRLPEWMQNALHFSLKTAARNATAGILKEDPAKALERVQGRLTAWAEGI